jgi:hypothetical protein
MKKIGIVITDGVGYRNFILSDFMVEAQKQFSRVVLLSCLPIRMSKLFLKSLLKTDIWQLNHKEQFEDN